MANPSKARGTAPLADRLRAKLQRDGECLVFTGYVDKQTGYGQIGIVGNKHIGAHRAAWLVTYGEIPEGLSVLHHCDNRKCCDVEHLFLGTHADNMRDCKEKGRNRWVSGESSTNAKLRNSQVDEIRQRHIPRLHPARGSGSSTKELADEFGVTKQYIWQLVKGKWRNHNG